MTAPAIWRKAVSVCATGFWGKGLDKCTCLCYSKKAATGKGLPFAAVVEFVS